MVATGRTVFEGDRLDEFKVHILGVLRNVIGPRRNLILARLEGGPLANTGVIAGMSGSPVYIDGRLVGAVSYSLGQFAKEPIAGITPFDEMVEAATLPAPRRQAARVELTMPLTPGLAARGAVAGLRVGQAVCRQPERRAAARRRRRSSAGIGTLLRPIATPITLGGFDTIGRRSGDGRVPRSRLPAGDGRRRAGAAGRVGRAAAAAAARRSHRRRADERRPRARRHRHGHRGGRRSRLRLRPSVLRPGPDRVPDDPRARARGAAEPHQLDEDRQHRRRHRHRAAGSRHDDCRHARRRAVDDSRDAQPAGRARHAQDVQDGDGARSAVHAAPRLSLDPQHAHVVRARERHRQLRRARHARR